MTDVTSRREEKTYAIIRADSPVAHWWTGYFNSQELADEIAAYWTGKLGITKEGELPESGRLDLVTMTVGGRVE